MGPDWERQIDKIIACARRDNRTFAVGDSGPDWGRPTIRVTCVRVDPECGCERVRGGTAAPLGELCTWFGKKEARG